MSAKHKKLWRVWLVLYLAWTTATVVWVYDDARQATQMLWKSNNLNIDKQIAACDTMNELATQEGQDQTLMELYLAIYQKNKSDNVLEQMRAFDAVENYVVAERAAGRHLHLEDHVHRILRDCATARFEIAKAKNQRNTATRKLLSHVGIVLLPPLVVLLGGAAVVSIVAGIRNRQKES